MNTQHINIDIVPGGIPTYVNVSQYDAGTRTLEMELFSSLGNLVIPAGVTAGIRGTKPDGNGFSYDATISGNTVTADVTKQMTAVAGNVICEVVITVGELEIASANFIIAVERAALDKDTLKSGSEIRELVEILDRTDEIIAAAHTVDEKSQQVAENTTTVVESRQVVEEAMASVTEKERWIARVTTSADLIAQQALEKAGNTENEVAEFQNLIDAMQRLDNSMTLTLEGKIDGAYVDSGYLYLTSNGSVVAGPLGPFSGTGGGGGGGTSGGNNASLTVTNTTGWLSKTIASGSNCNIKVQWSSVEDEMATGNGVMKITVNGALRGMLDIIQGEVTVDLAPYLAVGSNVVKITVSDVYGNSRTINYSVTSIALSISSPFDANVAYQGPISFPYVPTGNVSKTIHFKLDGREVGNTVTSVSGRQMTYTFSDQKHGAHTISCYFEAEINGEIVRSNELYFEVVCLEALVEDAVIVSSFHETEVDQYTSVPIDFIVYDPTSLQADVVISINGQVMSRQSVDRTQHSYTYRANEVGETTFTITCGEVSKTLTFTVHESEIHVDAETEDLKLYLSAAGRSNNEGYPGTWVYEDISAVFTRFNYTSDGWQKDEDGIDVLRVSGDARLTIPYQIFAQDFRSTGKTIELEFATRNVLDYDAEILSCMSENRGLKLTAQKATMKSEQSETFVQYKEEEHVRVSFVVEKRSENRLLYCYINGIMSGVVQYPTDDDFSQRNPVDISIGSNDCTLDLYAIRVYDQNLTRHQVLTNWIADTQIGSEMIERYKRNNIYDAYGNVVIAQLPSDLPYLVLEGEELPQYKGDKKTVSGSYTDPVYGTRSFTFTGAQIDVQGTSSQYYARKNYKMKFKNGFLMSSGNQSDGYPLRTGAIPTATFTFKADVASSEGANNVELARLYNDACPYKTPPQRADERVRQGIDGFPIVIFWSNGDESIFLGKYNFNNDKGTEEIFGFSEGDESWEIRNNTSDRVLWKSDDYEGTDWQNDFEARYPEDNEDVSNLASLATWLKSTDQSAATETALTEPVTYGDTTYTEDTAEYRLAKFKNELSDHMERDAVLFYYLFTELFLMVDSRAKNAFPSMLGGDKWFSLPYDFDTALGINNEGALVFDYSLEDIDQTDGGADVFNGQDSVLWVNVRQAFHSELQRMYQTLRSEGKLSYNLVESAFEEHQNKWPEAIFNEDAWFKYLQPLVESGTASYLAMLQGSKAEQRKWWLYNRFRYIDSKYNAGDALSDLIQLRGYAKANITVTPYADIYPSIKYGSYLVQKRGKRRQATLLTCPLDNVNDTEIYIYSASQLASVGDLSGLKVGFADFSKATKLQSLKIGDASESYNNGNLTELYLGNNTLLKTLDVRNCRNLTQTVDVSGCTNIEEIYFEGTAITGINLPNGGQLKKLHLPETMTNLTIRNQKSLTDLVMPTYENITSLWLENLPDEIDVVSIIRGTPPGTRLRVLGFNWEAESAEEIEAFLELLDTMRGFDEYGNNMDQAQMSGRIHTQVLLGSQIAAFNERYPHINVVANHTESSLFYYNYDGSQLLYTETIRDGGNGAYTGTPSRASTAANTFTFIGWNKRANQSSAQSDATKGIVADRKVYAAYRATGQTYTVRFYNGNTLLATANNVVYGETATYDGEVPVKTGVDNPELYEFLKWSPSPENVTGNRSCYAQFNYLGIEDTITDSWAEILAAERNGTYLVKYQVGDTKILDLGDEGRIAMQIAGFNVDTMADGSGTVPITWISQQLLNTSRRFNAKALVTNYETITKTCWIQNDAGDWISNNAGVDNSDASETWTITITRAGTFTVNAKVSSESSYDKLTVTVGEDKLVDAISGTTNFVEKSLDVAVGDVITVTALYHKDGSVHKNDDCGTVRFGGIAEYTVERTNGTFSYQVIDNYEESSGAIGGWEKSELRVFVKSLKSRFPATVAQAVKEVTKSQYCYTTAPESGAQRETTEDLWIPSNAEITGSTALYKDLFPDDASRIKQKAGIDTKVTWRLRNAADTSNVYYVTSSGSTSNMGATSETGIAIGFCT